MPLTLNHHTQIFVAIDYFNRTEKELFLGGEYPSAVDIQALMIDGISVPTAEFLTYYLFHRKSPESRDYRDYHSISLRYKDALTYMNENIDWNGLSVYSLKDPRSLLREIIEHVGESIGLSVINRIHGLTEADWDRIPESGKRPTFDFDIPMASNGVDFIQVENKGSCVLEEKQTPLTVLRRRLQECRRSIKKKKNWNNNNELNYGYPYRFLRYGTITVVGRSTYGHAKCFILDPDPVKTHDNPRRFRLLARMRFLRDWISFIVPDSELAFALLTRVNDLEKSIDPFVYDGQRLVDNDGNYFNFTSSIYYIPPDFETRWYNTSTFWRRRSHITDGPHSGIVIQISDKEMLFLGIREDLLFMASEQNYNRILNYQTDCGTDFKTVKCVFSPDRFKELRLPSHIHVHQDEDGFHYFYLSGQLQFSLGGLVFGILPFEHIYDQNLRESLMNVLPLLKLGYKSS